MASHTNPTPPSNDEFEQRADELIEAGRVMYSRGWVPATSGNLSARLSDDRIAITVSGKNKGQLTRDAIMLVDGDGKSLDGKKPSAEALLHSSIYRLYPGSGAVLHPHSPGATAISRLMRNEVILKDYELLKALAGVTTHETRVTIPIFPNDQNIARLAKEVERYARAHGPMLAYVIASHGLYTWGASVGDALRHVEALEFLFELELRLFGLTAS